MEQASQQGLTRDFSKLLLFFTETCTLPQKHIKPQKVSTHSAIVDLSSHQHLQQGEYEVKQADAAMRSLMMKRFLRAAADVAAEYESSISPSKQKTVSSPSSPQPSRRNMPITCCIKSRAQQAHSLIQHSAQQKDIMPRFMSAFFCLGIETLLFQAHCRVKSASGHFDRVRKRSWVPHLSYRTRVTSEGSSKMERPVACKKKGVKKFATTVLHMQEVETEETGMSPCKQAESPTKNKHDACAYGQEHEHLPAESRTKNFSRSRHGSLDSISDLYLSKAGANFVTYPAKWRNDMPDASGWPFGIFNSRRAAGSSHDKQQGKSSPEKLAVGGKVPYPQLPPAPTESWLGHAIRKNASRTSLVASLQQIEKKALYRRKSKCPSVDLDVERTSELSIREEVGRCGGQGQQARF